MRIRYLAAALAASWATLLLQSPNSTHAENWEWERASPESVGIDPAKLSAALVRIHEIEPHTHAALLIMDGRLVLDAEFYPYDGKELHNLASVTKSVMTTLIAIAAEQHKLDLDQPLLSFFPGRTIANRDARKERITVRHLTSMSSGLDCVGEHDEPTLHQMNASADWVQFALDLKMVAEPGSTFSYCSPGMHLLSAVLQQATGQSTLDFARKNLFEPMGTTDALWPADPQGVNHGWGDLHLHPRDVAKLGLLWWNKGNWNGRQIVSRKWVEASSSVQIKTRPPWDGDYGYGWWVRPANEYPHYAASGRGGQFVGVFPGLRTIAVTVGSGIDSGKVLQEVASAMVTPGKPIPPNPDATEKLKAVLAALKAPPKPGPVQELPGTARLISGKTYRFGPNPMGIATLQFEFGEGSEASMKVSFLSGEPPREHTIGLDGVYRFSPGENGLTAGMRGAWTSGDTFEAEYDGISAIDTFILTTRFQGNRLTMVAQERTYESPFEFEGQTAD